jgi:hypothetical protein
MALPMKNLWPSLRINSVKVEEGDNNEDADIEPMKTLMAKGLSKAFEHFEVKGKAVPLHAMEALWGRGGIAPTHSRPRH